MATDLDPATVVSAINSIAILLRHLSERVSSVERRLDGLEAVKHGQAVSDPATAKQLASTPDDTPKANQAQGDGFVSFANNHASREQSPTKASPPSCLDHATCDIRRHLEPLNTSIQILTTHVLRLEKTITQTTSQIPRPAKASVTSSIDSGHSNASCTLSSQPQSQGHIPRFRKRPSSTTSASSKPASSPALASSQRRKPATPPPSGTSWEGPWPAVSASTSTAAHGYMPPVFGQASTPASSVKNFGIDISNSPFTFYAGIGGASPFAKLAMKRKKNADENAGRPISEKAAALSGSPSSDSEGNRKTSIGNIRRSASLSRSTGQKEGMGPGRRQARTSFGPVLFRPMSAAMTRRSLPVLRLENTEKRDRAERARFDALPTRKATDVGYKRCSLLGETPEKSAKQKGISFEAGRELSAADGQKKWNCFEGLFQVGSWLELYILRVMER
ncbi:uncharacterized protein EI97DRAFT_35948 [Westerdykella ornata]|uniref:Uncharacterized protein n=1 Tax=Westerdykella ornata TaxID=318751 RepID=A0A6A6JKW7_WESOR|nr:uncharacterized protein EI97DRAFT_35948 [Westerdykella ornata]KAF2276336.1 hypothetical protein EI97DRAFT_35948 [Westerdykella ornata]